MSARHIQDESITADLFIDNVGAHSRRGKHAGHSPERRKRRRRRRRDRRKKIIITVVSVVVALVVILGISGFLLYRSAMAVMDEARTAMVTAQGIQEKISNGDSEGLASDINVLAEQTSAMRNEVSGPLWILGGFIPVLGEDISAARTLVIAIDDLASEALAPMSDVIGSISLDTLYADGRIDVDSLTLLADGLVEAAPIIESANESIQSIGEVHIDQLASVIDIAKSGMGTVADFAETTSELASVLPEMLGADGQTRNYLVVAMNNAEIRAGGGFAGAQGLVTITDGVISLGEFSSVMWVDSSQSVSITDEEYYLFQGGEFSGEAMTVTAGDSLYNPDFPRTASRISQFWTTLYGGTIDGVFALDPVLLQSFLSIMGGVTASDGTYLDGSNTAQYLMSDIYWLYSDGDTQDEVFADVASQAFDVIMNGIGSSTLVPMLTAWAEGVDDYRFFVWMADEEEQALIEELDFSGAISTDTTVAETGVYVSNYSWSKLDWYLDLEVTVGEQTVNSDGTSTYQMNVKMTNTLDPSMESSIPEYVRAWNEAALSRADELLRFHLYAPAGGSVDDVVATGRDDIVLQEGSYNGIEVVFADTHLQPGETITLTYTVTTSSAAGDAPLEVRATPTAQEF